MKEIKVKTRLTHQYAEIAILSIINDYLLMDIHLSVSTNITSANVRIEQLKRMN